VSANHLQLNLSHKTQVAISFMSGKVLLLWLSFNSTGEMLKEQRNGRKAEHSRCVRFRTILEYCSRLALGFRQQEVANDRVLGHARDHQFT
jgi:hypothetical protein